MSTSTMRYGASARNSSAWARDDTRVAAWTVPARRLPSVARTRARRSRGRSRGGSTRPCRSRRSAGRRCRRRRGPVGRASWLRVHRSRSRNRLTCEERTPPSPCSRASDGALHLALRRRGRSSAGASRPGAPSPRRRRSGRRRAARRAVFSGSAPSTIEVAVRGEPARLAARRQADLLQQDRERDGEAVVDRGVARRPRGCDAGLRPARCRAQRPAPNSVRLGCSADVLVRCGPAAADGCGPRARPSLAADDDTAQPPSETGQQSRIFSGEAIGREASTSAHRDRLAELRARMRCRHGGASAPPARRDPLRRYRMLVHVARSDQAVVGRDGRPQRHLVDRVARPGPAPGSRESRLWPVMPVLAADDQDVAAPRPTRPAWCASITMAKPVAPPICIAWA